MNKLIKFAENKEFFWVISFSEQQQIEIEKGNFSKLDTVSG